jgi:WD40 repeat protein
VTEQLLATSSRDKTAKSWSVVDGRLQKPKIIQTHTDWINFVVFVGDTTCCTICEDQTMFLWVLEEGAWQQTASSELEMKVTTAASVANEYICFGDRLGSTTIVSPASFGSQFAKYVLYSMLAQRILSHLDNVTMLGEFAALHPSFTLKPKAGLSQVRTKMALI